MPWATCAPEAESARKRNCDSLPISPRNPSKFVVAVGSCGISGGVFQGCYNIVGSLADVIPVNAFVPGCPPRPEALLEGLMAIQRKIAQEKATRSMKKAGHEPGLWKPVEGPIIVRGEYAPKVKGS